MLKYYGAFEHKVQISNSHFCISTFFAYKFQGISIISPIRIRNKLQLK